MRLTRPKAVNLIATQSGETNYRQTFLVWDVKLWQNIQANVLARINVTNTPIPEPVPPASPQKTVGQRAGGERGGGGEGGGGGGEGGGGGGVGGGGGGEGVSWGDYRPT